MNLRSVRAEFILGTGGVVGAWFKFGDGDAEVVRFLEEDATVAGLGEAPDVIGSMREDLEVRTIGTHTGEFAVNKGDF